MNNDALKNGGFTLIEVIIAIALLGIISASLLTFLPTVVSLNRKTSQEQTNTVVAKRFFEEVRADWKVLANFQNAQLASGTSLNNYAVPNSGCTSTVQDPDAGTASVGARKRVTLTCTGLSSPFSVEFGRPS